MVELLNINVTQVFELVTAVVEDTKKLYEKLQKILNATSRKDILLLMDGWNTI